MHTFDYVNMAICKTVGCRAKSLIHHWALPTALRPAPWAGRGPPTRSRAAAALARTPLALLSAELDAIQVATVTRSKAHRITVAAHTNNLAVVTTTWKQMAKTYCIKLQKFGLTSSIAPGDGGGDDGGSDGPETQ